MLLDDLVGVIETLQQRMEKHRFVLQANETRTRMALIDPLLSALGWDTTDPGLVYPEYIASGRADYALLGPSENPVMFIEAKKLGEGLDSHRLQMLNYSNASGVEYAGLTDGNHWEMYQVFQRGTLDERRILDVTIAGKDTHQLALQLLLLWRPNLSSGKPMPPNEPIAEWEPEKPVEAAGSPPIQPAASPSEGLVTLAAFVAEVGCSPPSAIRFSDGSDRKVSHWKDIQRFTAEWLWREKLLTLGNVPVKSGNKRFILNKDPHHQSGNPFANQIKLEGTPLVMEGSVSSKATINNAKTLLTHCGQDTQRVQLRI